MNIVTYTSMLDIFANQSNCMSDVGDCYSLGLVYGRSGSGKTTLLQASAFSLKCT